MTSLADIAQHFGTDKFEHGYCPHYETHLGNLYAEQPMRLLEIGIMEGASLRMWHEWLPYAEIYGIDINPASMMAADSGISTMVYDAGSFNAPWVFPDEFDVIIDDGSHLSHDILTALNALWQKLKPGGWYIIEDWAVAWLPEWGGNAEVGTQALAEIHRAMDCTLRAEGVAEFHAYEQIVFMRKA